MSTTQDTLLNVLRGSIELGNFSGCAKHCMLNMLDHLLRNGKATLYGNGDFTAHQFQYLPSEDDLSYFEIDFGKKLTVYYDNVKICELIGRIGIDYAIYSIANRVHEVHGLDTFRRVADAI